MCHSLPRRHPESYSGTGADCRARLYAGVLDNSYYNSRGLGESQRQPLCVRKLRRLHDVNAADTVADTHRQQCDAGPGTWPLMVSASGVNYCSPITEIYNGTQDRLYVSVNANGINAPGGCSGTAGCVFMFDITSGTWSPAVTPGCRPGGPGGTSGIVVDNISSDIRAHRRSITRRSPVPETPCKPARRGYNEIAGRNSDFQALHTGVSAV